MTREEAINEINKVFTSAYANYIVIALTEGATVSDIQHRWGRAYEAGVKDGLEQELCEDAVSRAEVLNLVRFNAFHVKSQIKAIENMPSVTTQEPRKGHWIDIKNKNGTVIATRCSRCGNSPKHAIKSDFCPNCGVDMRCDKGCDFCEHTSECMPSGNGGQEDGKA